MAELNRLWRLAATAFSFALFGIGGLCCSLLLVPPLRLWPGTPLAKRRRGQALVHRLFRLFVGLMAGLGVLRYRVSGTQQLIGLQGHVVVANHPSLIDVVLLLALLPNSNCVIKGSLLRNPLIRQILLAAGFIPNSLPAEHFLARCQQVLSEGDNLIIFPEGTRTTPGQPFKLQRSAAQISLRCGAPLLPVTIRCTPTTLTKAEPWYRIPRQQPLFRLDVASSLALPTLLEQQPESATARGLTRCIEQIFLQELAKP